MGVLIIMCTAITVLRKGLYAGLNLWKTSTARKTQPLMIDNILFGFKEVNMDKSIDKICTDFPSGEIHLHSYRQLGALWNAVCAAQDMYKSLVKDSDITHAGPRISIKAITESTFRVEVSAQVEMNDEEFEFYKKDEDVTTETITMEELEKACQ